MGIHGGAFQLILAGAEHQIAAAGGDDRPGRESPLDRAGIVVAQGKTAQIDGPVGGVVQFHPVAQVAVLVPDTGPGSRHDFVDHQHAGGHREIGDEGVMALHGILVAGRILDAALPYAVLVKKVAFVGIEGRDQHLVDGHAAGVEQKHAVPVAGQLHFGMERLKRVIGVGAVAKHQDAFSRGQGHVREKEFDPVTPVAQSHVPDIHAPAGGIGDFDPVAESTVFIGQGGFVVRHHLGDPQPDMG